MFAREEGAVAAPTAALHFTPRLIEALDARGIGRETLTLHVGAGTFLPVKAEDTGGHKMHAEWGRIDAATADRLNAVRAAGGRLIAVGTTSLRLLESAAGEDGTIQPFEGDTAIFITPGYRFKAIDGLITNFHLPRSTLFMLVSALMGLEVMKAAYAHAIAAADTASTPMAMRACCCRQPRDRLRSRGRAAGDTAVPDQRAERSAPVSVPQPASPYRPCRASSQSIWPTDQRR